MKTSLKAQLDEELDLKEGEIITITEILKDGWCKGCTENGKEGIFPENFVIFMDQENIDDTDKSIIKNEEILPSIFVTKNSCQDLESTSNSVNQAQYSDPLPNYNDPLPNYNDIFPNIKPKIEDHNDKLNSIGLKPYAISIYPFNGQFPNELCFESGQVIELLRYIDNEWVEGMIDSTIGIFPVSYVNVIVDCNEIQNYAIHEETQKTQESLQPNDRVKVEFTFEAQMDGDLNVFAGEIVEIVEVTNDDWITVKNDHGESGLCPRSYLINLLEDSNHNFQDALDDFVVLRNEEKDSQEREIENSKRVSEPHRPAPPAPSPGRIPLQKQTSSVTTLMPMTNNGSNKEKKADQRQNVISELYLTEKDYVRDLKMTFETFHLHNPSFLESKGIEVNTLFGNISEIIEVAEEILELIQRAMKGFNEDNQSIGPCFLEMSEKMRSAYGKYCSNYELALGLMQKVTFHL